MKRLTFVLLLACLYSTASAQTPGDTAAARIRQLLTPGKHLVHYFRSDPKKQLTPEQQALVAKIRNALTETTNWVLDPDSARRETGTRDEILGDVRKKLNLTEAEWTTLQDLTDVAKKEVEIYGTDTLEITTRGDLLSFRGTGKAARLDSVPFELAQNAAWFRQRRIPFMNVFHIAPADNAFHIPLVTYAYEFNLHWMTDSTDLSTLHMERYDFGLSYQAATRRTMVMFMSATMHMEGPSPVVVPVSVEFLID